MSAAARSKRWGVSSSESSRVRFHQVRTFHPTYLTGRAIEGTGDNLGRQKQKEMISTKWIASDGSELIPAIDVDLTLLNLT
jgi:hypothetical protein